jgi:predicted enzyme related to lactoylglutathione lyase
MPRVVHFEIHADDPERAVRFYQNLFGWQITKWDGPAEYWLLKTGSPGQPGIDGGLLRRRGPQQGDAVIAYVCTIDVPSVDEYTEKATREGAQVVLPKMAIPNVGWLVYCKDTEGNIFGMMQPDPAARMG